MRRHKTVFSQRLGDGGLQQEMLSANLVRSYSATPV